MHGHISGERMLYFAFDVTYTELQKLFKNPQFKPFKQFTRCYVDGTNDEAMAKKLRETPIMHIFFDFEQARNARLVIFGLIPLFRVVANVFAKPMQLGEQVNVTIDGVRGFMLFEQGKEIQILTRGK